ncbi:MAG: helix-turn-helix domain-containing protein [Acidimicrobiia bacterium]
MTDNLDLSQVRARAIEDIRSQYPPLLTTAQVGEMMQCTVGEVRDQVHRGELPAVRWGQQFRFFRDEVLAVLLKRTLGPNDQHAPAAEGI